MDCWKSQKPVIIKSILSRCVLDELLIKFDFLTKFICPECYAEMFSVPKFGVQSSGHSFCLHEDLYKLQYILGLHPEIIMFFVDRERVEQNFFENVTRLGIECVPFYICSSKHLRDCVRDVNFLGEIEEHYKSDLFSTSGTKETVAEASVNMNLDYEFTENASSIPAQIDSSSLLRSQNQGFDHYFAKSVSI